MGSLLPLFIPSPSQGVWHLGPVPIRAYALCIVTGVVAAVVIGERRWVARGGRPGQVQDVAIWAVPFGLVGARVYHVCTDHDLYFGPGRNPWDVFAVWHGGLGIWGAIMGGVLGAALVSRRMGFRLLPLMDALAPALLVAQAIGRVGNYFNQELFGRPTSAPWALKIDAAHWPPPYSASNPPPTVHAAQTAHAYATFHPTFLYEMCWDLGCLGIVLWADRRFRLGYGRVFALYVMCYTAGRAWIENLRIDNVELKHVFGLRFNVWVSIVMFLASTAYFLWAGRRHQGREDRVLLDEPEGEGHETGQPHTESQMPPSRD